MVVRCITIHCVARAAVGSMLVKPLHDTEMVGARSVVHQGRVCSRKAVLVHPLNHMQMTVHCRPNSCHRRAPLSTVLVQPLHNVEMPVSSGIVHSLICTALGSIRTKLLHDFQVAVQRRCIHSVTISSVVRHFKQFADEQSSQFKSCERTEAMPLRAGNQPYHLDRFVFSELGSTIKSFREKLEQKCSLCRESQAAIRYILKRALDVHRLLQTQHRLPSDVAVVSYCEVLLGLDRFLGNAVLKASVLLRAKSQRVALQSHLLHRRLDELLELLAPPTIAPIHEWRQRVELRGGRMESDCIDDGNVSREGNEVAPAGGSAAVKIVRFKTDSLNERFQELDIRTNKTATRSDDARLWLIHSYDLKYDRDDQIGIGAFGAVYRATWLGTPVVIKFMGYEADQDTFNRELFLHELRVWFPLSHPHVVKLYGACHVGKLFFVCEFAGNGTLSGYLKRYGNTEKSWQLLYQVALGLKYLHEQNTLHNDLKCDNVLIGSDGDAKITDFGLSSILNSAEVKIDPKNQGALQWKSPEYMRGDRLTLASDIYSFGMCILEAVTDKTPWGSMAEVAVRFQVVRKGKLPFQPSCLSDLQWNLIRMMCATEPSKRVKISFVVDKLHEFWQRQ